MKDAVNKSRAYVISILNKKVLDMEAINVIKRQNRGCLTEWDNKKRGEMEIEKDFKNSRKINDSF